MKHAHSFPFGLDPVSVSAIRRQHPQDVTKHTGPQATTPSNCVTVWERRALWMRGHHAQNPLPNLSCCQVTSWDRQLSHTHRAGLCCKKKMLPLLTGWFWSVVQQDPKLLHHSGNCHCDFSSCASAWSLCTSGCFSSVLFIPISHRHCSFWEMGLLFSINREKCLPG